MTKRYCSALRRSQRSSRPLRRGLVTCILATALVLSVAGCVYEPYPPPPMAPVAAGPAPGYYPPAYYAAPCCYAYPEYPPAYGGVAFEFGGGGGGGRGGGWDRGHWR